ncbi:MAG TPA: hypothetical protein VJT15_02575 [Pyrinomonadaceae bacterium]|nr:hypothetical protein [Pyrinomonadaceae bacterium]
MSVALGSGVGIAVPQPLNYRTERGPKAFDRAHLKQCLYRLVLLRAFRGLPTLRSFNGSRSFGLITHIFPTFVAFKRPLSIIFRTRLEVTFKRFAASAALISFMAQV